MFPAIHLLPVFFVYKVFISDKQSPLFDSVFCLPSQEITAKRTIDSGIS